MTRTIQAILAATLIVLAGCAGGVTNMTATPTQTQSATQNNDITQDSADQGDATIQFYISDEKNAIEDFAHLNVTITKVGLKPKTNGPNDTTTPTTTTATTKTPTTNTATANTPTTNTATANTPTTTGSAQDESNEKAGWVIRDVDDQTIDLTQYQGKNATLLGQFSVPNGTYTTVFVYVSEINATLKDGSQVNVKLPSRKLQIHTQFTVSPNESVDFVFDISVFKAGKSGMYILKPVISQSGTDVEINPKGDQATDKQSKQNKQNKEKAPAEKGNEQTDALNASLLGDVVQGENVTVKVTKNGSAIEDAQIFLNNSRIGETNTNGTLTFQVPDDANEIKIVIRYKGTELTIKHDVKSSN
ncbi:MAG: DUF4382 domain-containing protein [Halobacteriaceae archaeon]